jgi:chemotaxis protein MotA
MFYLVGILVTVVCVSLSVLHLKQDLDNYFDFVGFLVVLGGTAALSIMIFPWQLRQEMRVSLKWLLLGRKVDFSIFNSKCFAFIQNARRGVFETQVVPQGTLADQILNDGAELIQLGFEAEKIQGILEERVYQWGERMHKVAGAFRSLAKYPPAFGLVGTVLGLVSLMRAISQGASSTEAGVRMAVALVATLYGLMVANLIINPAGERITLNANEEKKAAELAIQAVMLCVARVNLVEAQEVLNSYVKPSERIQLNKASLPEEDTA